jgi:hypothetical protein
MMNLPSGVTVSALALAEIRVAEERPAERVERHRNLRRLDRCLELLESAMERNRTVVSSRDAAIITRVTRMVGEGMPLPTAIEIVLHLQEPYMRSFSWPAPRQGCQVPPVVGDRRRLPALVDVLAPIALGSWSAWLQGPPVRGRPASPAA